VDLGGQTLSVGGSLDAVFGGSLFGTNGAVVKSGTGVWTLGGTSTFGGGLSLSGGALQLDSDTALGTGTLSLVAGRLSASGTAARTVTNAVALAGDVTLGDAVASGTLTFAGSGVLGANRTLTLASDVGWTGGIGDGGNGFGLTKTGSGTLMLSGSNTYLGTTTVNGGVLSVAGGSAVADASAVVVGAAGTLSVLASETVGSVSGSGWVRLEAGTLAVAGAVDAVYAGVISGSGALVKSGSAAWTLTGSNDFSGGVTIHEGALLLGSDTALGTGTLTVHGGTLSSSDAGARTLNNALAVYDASTLGSLLNPGTLTFASGVYLGANQPLTVLSGVEFGGEVRGATGIGLIKMGAATLTLSAPNAYLGETVVGEGTLRLSGSGRLASGTITVASGATWELPTAGYTVAAGQTLRGAGTVSGSLTLAGQSTLTLENNAALASLALNGNVSINGTVRLRLGSGFTADTLNVGGLLSFGLGAKLKLLDFGGVVAGRYDIATIGLGSPLGALLLDDDAFALSRLRAVLDKTTDPTKLTLVLSNPGERELYTWGDGSAGALGFPAVASQTTPQKILATGSADTIQMAIGGTHSVGLYSDGTVWTTGSAGMGQLGDGGVVVGSTSGLTVVRGALEGKRVVSVAAGASHSVAITDEGRAYAWGSTANGRLGGGVVLAGTQNYPGLVTSSGVLLGRRLVAAVAGGGASNGGHTLALDSEGRVYAWGRGLQGQLGSGLASDAWTPVNVTSTTWTGRKVVMLAAGELHSVALDESGGVHTWGDNSRGQLGDGTVGTAPRPTPVALGSAMRATVNTPGAGYFSPPSVTLVGGGGTGARAVATVGGGRVLSVTITSMGTGYTSAPQVSFSGGGGFGASATITLNAMPVMVSVAAGGAHTLAIDNQGRVWAWGNNGRGQLGRDPGTTTSSSVPLMIAASAFGNQRVLAVAAGSDHSLALTEDGVVWAWGSHSSGQLGNNAGAVSTFAFSAVPVRVGAASGPPVASATGLSASGNRSAFLGGVYLATPPQPVAVPSGIAVIKSEGRLAGDVFGVLSKAAVDGGRLQYQWFRGNLGQETLDAFNVRPNGTWYMPPGTPPRSVFVRLTALGSGRVFFSDPVFYTELGVTGETTVVKPPVGVVLPNGVTTTTLEITTNGTPPSFSWTRNGSATGLTPEAILSGANTVGSRLSNVGEGVYAVTVNTGTAATTQTLRVGVRSWSSLAGVYQALLENRPAVGGTVDSGSSTDMRYPGRVTVSLTSSASFSGKLDYEGVTYSLAGSFDQTSLNALAVINRGAALNPVALELKFTQDDLANLTMSAATVEDLRPYESGPVWLARSTANPTQLAASATLCKAVTNPSVVNAPAGMVAPVFSVLFKDASATPTRATGIAAMTANANGLVTALVTLGDGADGSVTGSLTTYLGCDGTVSLYRAPYGNSPATSGIFAGRVKLDWSAGNPVSVAAGEELEWKKPDATTGFSAKLTPLGSGFDPSMSMEGVMGVSSGLALSVYAPTLGTLEGAAPRFGLSNLTIRPDWTMDPAAQWVAFGTWVAQLSVPSTQVSSGSPWMTLKVSDSLGGRFYQTGGIILQRPPGGVPSGVYGVLGFVEAGTSTAVWSEWTIR
jgi:autotransporter-associated beta strand protein